MQRETGFPPSHSKLSQSFKDDHLIDHILLLCYKIEYRLILPCSQSFRLVGGFAIRRAVIYGLLIVFMPSRGLKVVYIRPRDRYTVTQAAQSSGGPIS
jgi:hypothetical protein